MSKFLAIIPARGGSKRLPRKNTLNLGGKPLITWTIEAAKNSEYVDAICVSSDDDEILAIADEFQVQAIPRPSTLASDTATTFDAIEHTIKANKNKYEYIVLLQPTSPLRTAQHIDEAIMLLNKKSADAVISVCEMEHSPLWSNTLPDDWNMTNFLSADLQNKRSQDLSKYYRLNGAIYICRTDRLLIEKSFFLSRNISAYLMELENSVDIDSMLDFQVAEALLRLRKND
ncbi:MAG: acylneuraminate cytidylyltransferase family protein [Ostreibacterium sp.]